MENGQVDAAPDRDAAATTEVAPPRLKPVPLWLVALIVFSGTLGLHILVPALPLIASDFATSPGVAQLSISFYILGLAVGQLVIGPLSDRYGRRPVLMAGLCLYIAGGFAAAFAPSIQTLIVARLFQSLGGCAGLVLGRAIVRDGTVLSDAARRLAMLNLLVVIGPGVAPIVGALIGSIAGWRSIFFALCLLGISNFFLTWRLLPETSNTANAQGARTIMRHYFQLLRTPAFVGYAIGGGCSTTSFYSFVAAAPFIIVDQLHRPEREVSAYLAMIILGVWLGSLAATRLARRGSANRMMVGANLLSLSGAVVLLIAALSGQLTVLLAIGPMMVFAFGTGIASPSALVEAISVNTKITGSASGVYGFAQMGVGAVCVALTGLGSNPAIAAATVLVGASVIAQLAFFIAIRSSRKRKAEVSTS